MRLMSRGVRTRVTVELPAEPEALRVDIRAFVAQYEGLPKQARRMALSGSGCLAPDGPKPQGRDAGPMEQLVVEEEFQGERLLGLPRDPLASRRGHLSSPAQKKTEPTTSE